MHGWIRRPRRPRRRLGRVLTAIHARCGYRRERFLHGRRAGQDAARGLRRYPPSSVAGPATRIRKEVFVGPPSGAAFHRL